MTAKTKAESPPPLDLVLKGLAERRVALDKLDDKLSALIRRIESVLRKQVSTRISRTLEHDGSSNSVELLTFGKYDGKFILMIESGYVAPDGEIEIRDCTPLLSTSREMRTRVFADGHVEQLIRNAHGQFMQQIAMREKALSAAEQIANALGSFNALEDSTTSDSSPDDGIPF